MMHASDIYDNYATRLRMAQLTMYTHTHIWQEVLFWQRFVCTENVRLFSVNEPTLEHSAYSFRPYL